MHAKVENPPKISKSTATSCAKRLASVTTENRICGHNWSDSGKRGENDWLVGYSNGLVVYGKQKGKPTVDSLSYDHWSVLPDLLYWKDPPLYWMATRSHNVQEVLL